MDLGLFEYGVGFGMELFCGWFWFWVGFGFGLVFEFGLIKGKYILYDLEVLNSSSPFSKYFVVGSIVNNLK